MHRYVPTPLDHSTAAVSLDIPSLDMPAMVRNLLRKEILFCQCIAHVVAAMMTLLPTKGCALYK